MVIQQQMEQMQTYFNKEESTVSTYQVIVKIMIIQYNKQKYKVWRIRMRQGVCSVTPHPPLWANSFIFIVTFGVCIA